MRDVVNSVGQIDVSELRSLVEELRGMRNQFAAGAWMNQTPTGTVIVPQQQAASVGPSCSLASNGISAGVAPQPFTWASPSGQHGYRFDDGGFWSNAHPERLIFPVSGRYFIAAQYFVNGEPNITYQCVLTQNRIGTGPNLNSTFANYPTSLVLQPTVLLQIASLVYYWGDVVAGDYVIAVGSRSAYENPPYDQTIDQYAATIQAVWLQPPSS